MVPLKTHTSKRVGPLEILDRGQYKGMKVEDIIRKNPSYIMYSIKEWLDISPSQAFLFEEVTGGGIVPDEYIKTPPQEDWLKGRDSLIYFSNQDILPNWDFFLEDAPGWWQEYKEKSKRMDSISQRVDLYNSYVKKEWLDFQSKIS